MQPYYKADNIALYCGNCLDALATLPEASVDYVVTDPPYLLDFMAKDWDSSGGDIPTNELVFRSWLAGLVAGEACFRIHREKGGAYYACEFSIKMRADEGPLLRALARRTCAGHVVDIPPQSGAVESGPAVKWVVQSKADCWKIANLLDGTPLYAKKQREYDLWRRALRSWTETPRGNRWHGPRDNTVMEALWEEMKTLRPFDKELADADFDQLRQPDYLFHNRWAKACLRVIKPGGIMLAFGGTRTWHRLACAIEDAGWEVRDCLMWLHGQGMPKCGDIGKMIDKAKGATREVVGTKLGLPGYSLANHGRTNEVYGDLHNPEAECAITAPATPEAALFTGWAMALKPAWEPIVLAMKPMKGTIADNAVTWGMAGMNIDASRIACEGGSPSQNRRQGAVPVGDYNGWKVTSRNGYKDERPGEALGRWPANVLVDEEAAAQLDAQAEGVSRFFYTAKASKSERNPEGVNNDHPTVKPLALMEYLLTLCSSPTGGVVLDPFAGSGTTLVAAKRLGRTAIGVELTDHNCEIAKARIAQV